MVYSGSLASTFHPPIHENERMGDSKSQSNLADSQGIPGYVNFSGTLSRENVS